MAALMELEETLYWLEIVEGAGLMDPKKLEPLKTEANELIAIFISLIKKYKPR
jgi:four helix bundle protein